MSFFDLPPELRNRIYEDSVPQNQVILVSKSVDPPESAYLQPAFQDYEFSFPRLPALAGVNRQVRAEALSMYYGSNIFEAHAQLYAETFVKRLDSRSLTKIRDIRVTTYQISAVQQLLKPKLEDFVNYTCKGFLSRNAAKVPLRTRRRGRGSKNCDFEVTWVSLAELDLWERDPRDIDMVRRVTFLSRY